MPNLLSWIMLSCAFRATHPTCKTSKGLLWCQLSGGQRKITLDVLMRVIAHYNTNTLKLRPLLTLRIHQVTKLKKFKCAKLTKRSGERWDEIQSLWFTNTWEDENATDDANTENHCINASEVLTFDSCLDDHWHDVSLTVAGWEPVGEQRSWATERPETFVEFSTSSCDNVSSCCGCLFMEFSSERRPSEAPAASGTEGKPSWEHRRLESGKGGQLISVHHQEWPLAVVFRKCCHGLMVANTEFSETAAEIV